MAISDEIREQNKKFKDMTLEQKADYIYTYYKWWIIITLAVILFITFTIKTVIRNSKPAYISATFLNSTVGSSVTDCTLGTEFLTRQGVDLKEDNSDFDYVTYIDNDYGNQQAMAGQVKLISKYSAQMVDIVCGPEDVLLGAADVGGYGNLEEILPEGMLEKLMSKGYEPFYYTEKIYDEDSIPDEDGNREYTDGETYIGGLYIDNCKKLIGSASTCVYPVGTGERMVLAIAWNTPNVEHAIQFIEFVTE